MAIERKLKSMTDENSILVTISFPVKGCRLKDSSTINTIVDIDLIVDKNLTLGNFFDYLPVGIYNYLVKVLHVTPEEIKSGSNCICFGESTTYVNTSGRHVDGVEYKRVTLTEMPGELKRLFTGKGEIAKLKKGASKMEKTEEAIDDSRDVSTTNTDNLSTETTEDDNNTNYNVKEVYAICYNNLKKCLESFSLDSDSGNCRILVDRYNRNKPFVQSATTGGEESFLVLKKEWKNEKLKDCGIITASRIFFNVADVEVLSGTVPLERADIGALVDRKSRYHHDSAFKNIAPKYNISDEPLKKLDDEPVKIIPPTDMPKKQKQNFLASIMPSVVMAIVMIGLRLVLMGNNSGGFGSNIIIYAGMAIVSFILVPFNLYLQNKEYKNSLEEWKTQYEQYVNKLIIKIKERQSRDVKNLIALYPPVHHATIQTPDEEDLLSKALKIDGDLYSHDKSHPDFMKVRIGTTDAGSCLSESVFPIVGEKKEAVFTSARYRITSDKKAPFSIVLPKKNESRIHEDDKYLINLPENLANRYQFLKGSPVRLDLIKNRSLGLVSEEKEKIESFLTNIIFQLCYYHSPEDLQIVMFCTPTKDIFEQQSKIQYYKYLPHFRELMRDVSPFAFNNSDADAICNKLLEILSDQKSKKSDAKYPRILVIFEDGADFSKEQNNELIENPAAQFKKHLVSQFLPMYEPGEKKTDNNISFIFCSPLAEQLPKYCDSVICYKDQIWVMSPHEQLIPNDNESSKYDDRQYRFLPDRTVEKNEDILKRYLRGFLTISAMYYDRIEQGADIPSAVDYNMLLTKLGAMKKDDSKKAPEEYYKEYVNKNWRTEKDTSTSLSVPIGLKGNGIVNLDLSERADGPHMLVAGTTGSGKTETILTFLITLCAIYSPKEVNLLLVDMKGAGFVKRIGSLPHVVGKVTDISGDETGTGMAYMLKRFLASMNAEIRNRKRLLSKMDVDSVDEYNKAIKNLDNHIQKHKDLSSIRLELEGLNPLPHLFLIIDEFTELMKFSSENDDVDFKKSITSLARIGRSLGFHIILISQNIEGAITEDIKINSRARLCLKVATREASKSMIGNDLAASPSMPGNGRAYLLIGTGSRFEYFQSAYTGAGINQNMDTPTSITQVDPSGPYLEFYDSEKDKVKNTENTKKKEDDSTQLKAMVEAICIYNSENMEFKPTTVFYDPLPDACYYDYDQAKYMTLDIKKKDPSPEDVSE